MIRRRYFHLTTPIGYTVFSCGSWAHALSATMIYLLRLVQRLANYWMPDPATASLFIASSSSSLELGHGASKTTTSLSLYTIYIYIRIYTLCVCCFFFSSSSPPHFSLQPQQQQQRRCRYIDSGRDEDSLLLFLDVLTGHRSDFCRLFSWCVSFRRLHLFVFHSLRRQGVAED